MIKFKLNICVGFERFENDGINCQEQQESREVFGYFYTKYYNSISTSECISSS